MKTPQPLKSQRIELNKRDEHDGRLLPNDGCSQFLRNAFASGHINVMLGSAFSLEVVPTLGRREYWFQAVEKKLASNYADSSWKVASSLLRAEYFRSVMSPLQAVSPTDSQKDFLSAITRSVSMRGTTTIPKRANVFTTNYDPLIELALEGLDVAYNDGFTGRNNPTLDSSSFSRLQHVQSLFMEYVSPITTVNVVKLHGSLTWRRQGEMVLFSQCVDTLNAVLNRCSDAIRLSEVDSVKKLVKNECDDAGLAELKMLAENLTGDGRTQLGDFRANYNSVLCIVNPAKSKFEETVLERHYYDLLRIYANELDRNNALLLVSGFSFRDEHIRDLTIRAAKSNPRLLVFIACHKAEKAREFEGYFPNCTNVYYLIPKNGMELGVSELAEVIKWITG